MPYVIVTGVGGGWGNWSVGNWELMLIGHVELNHGNTEINDILNEEIVS